MNHGSSERVYKFVWCYYLKLIQSYPSLFVENQYGIGVLQGRSTI